MDRLKKTLEKINNKGYKAYKSLKGIYNFPDYQLLIDHVQGDPYASPSKIRIKINQEKAGFPEKFFATKIRKVAAEDFLTRTVFKAIKKIASGNRGTGNSGLIFIQEPGQEIIERTSIRLKANILEARMRVGLPADGRRIKSKDAYEMLFQELPQIISTSLFLKSINHKKIELQVRLAEDQKYLRNKLTELNLVTFIANNSILPRASGISDLPMSRDFAVPFNSPKELEVKVNLPNRGSVKGMGIPKGITIIVGGGYHGKTTLLKSIERGVYNHIPGDGRELVISNKDSVKIRAEDGRWVEKVDISPFISTLPGNIKTTSFSTEDASGSTSQAANIIEALEIGTSLLLIDEDTSATNFMIRDERMQALVAKDKEPITPFIDKARSLYAEYEVSSIIVIGGSGDYFDIAQTVVMMENYLPKEVTKKAKKIIDSHPTRRISEGGEKFGLINQRRLKKDSLNPYLGTKMKVKNKGLNIIQYKRTIIDLSLVEQLLDKYQTACITSIILNIWKNYPDRKVLSLNELISSQIEAIKKYGLEILTKSDSHPGELTLPRPQEIAAAINRMRKNKII